MGLVHDYDLRSPDPRLDQFNEAVLLGEYDVPLTRPRPVILDIGACVGAFSVWAHSRWPDATIHAYEPNPALHEALRGNVARLCGGKVTVHPCAVTGSLATELRLYLGKDNAGESSTAGRWHRDKAHSLMVDSVAASSLPHADFIKIDAEGEEWPIVAQLQSKKRLQDVSAVAYEYHSREDRNDLEDALVAEGFSFHAGSYLNAIGGTQRWVRR